MNSAALPLQAAPQQRKTGAVIRRLLRDYLRNQWGC
jgi:hypothetical protein